MHTFIRHCKKIQNEKGLTLINVRSDHGGEFENHGFESFCNEHDNGHNFSAPRTPQQNGIVKRKNRILKEMVRIIFVKTIYQNIFGEKQ